MPRTWRPNFRIPGGGVAAIIKDTLPYSLVAEVSAPDLLVLEVGNVCIISAYVLPENTRSRWSQWTDVEPCERLAAAIFHCTTVIDKPVILAGDLNARTRSVQSASSTLKRNSPDTVLSTRGRWLMRIAESYSLAVLNGTTVENSTGPGALTSFQKGGSAIVDYLMISESSLLPHWRSLKIFRPHPTADHCAIAFSFLATLPPRQPPLQHTSESLVFAADTKIDEVLHDLLTKPQLQFHEAISKIYGPLLVTEGATNVRLAVASSTGANTLSSACCMWNTTHFRSLRLSDASYMDAAVNGLILILMLARPHKPLRVYTSCISLIQLVCYDIVPISANGWASRYRDPLQLLAELVRARRGALQLELLRPSQSTPIFESAENISRLVLRGDLPPSHDVPTRDAVVQTIQRWSNNIPVPVADSPTAGLLKVYTRVSRRLVLSVKKVSADTASVDVDPGSAGHRGRVRVRRIMTRKLNQLVNCADPARWWRIIKALDAVKQGSLTVPLPFLAENFTKRMNPPSILPWSFDKQAYAADRLFHDLLPPTTADVTPDLDFTRAFTSQEVDCAKRHIRAHSLHSAKGVDGVSYQQILSLESEDLAELFNACVATRTCPKKWLVTMLIGIQKRGKPADNPDSYRIIALECCLLKLLTLLCITRLRAWITAIGLLPDSQNGFRPGMRTQNCPFVLRTAIDKARSTDDVLYVAFMDLTNAFPSTNRPTLWRVLYDNDARGPIIDWLRMVYDRMEYVVTGGERHEFFSAMFKSLWGILAGDSGSPDLFNIYMASFLPPLLDCHISLNNRPVCNVEQADDICMWTRTALGLQILVHYCVLIWCALSFLVANTVKSNYMIFGPLPTHLVPIRSADEDLALVKSFTYVGVTFQSTSRDIFALHYHKKEASARHVTMMIFKKEGFFGTIDTPSLMRMYMSQVDPHLTFGCEVAIDVSLSLLRSLERRQCSYLRRALGLHKRSGTAIVFFLTGTMPLKFRRLLLQLRYLAYLVGGCENAVAAAAYAENILLLRNNCPCWLGDLLIAVRRTLPSIPLPITPSVTLDASWIADASAQIRKAACISVNNGVLSDHTVPLLHRPHLPSHRRLRLHPFLSLVIIPAHRRALTLLVTGCSQLYVVTGRHQHIPREERVCRLCPSGDLEDELHVLFTCNAIPLFAGWREEFFQRIQLEWPDAAPSFSSLGPAAFVRRVLDSNNAFLLQAFARLCAKTYFSFIQDVQT